MTQEPLDAFETTSQNDVNPASNEPVADNTSSDDPHQIVTVLISGDPGETYNDHIDMAIDALSPVADDVADEIPRYKDKPGKFAEFPDSYTTQVYDDEEGIKATIHALPYGIFLDGRCAVADDIHDVVESAVESDTTDFLSVKLEHLGGDTRELADHVEQLFNAGIRIETPRLTLNGNDEAGKDDIAELIRVIGDAGHSIIPVDPEDLVNTDSVGGRPPLGFEYDDSGDLTTTHDYQDICAELAKCKAEDGQSFRATAREIGCAARTVKRCIEEHPDRYSL